MPMKVFLLFCLTAFSLSAQPFGQTIAFKGASRFKPSGTPDVTSGRVGWWRFDEDTGTVANDSSGSGNAEYFTNSPSWTTGVINSAAHFTGGSYSAAYAAPAGTYPITMCAWVKLDSTTLANGSAEIIVSQIQVSTLAAFYCAYFRNDASGGTGLKMIAQDTSGANFLASFYVMTYDTGWHHLVFEWNSISAQTIYVDGAVVSASYQSGGGGNPNPSGLNMTFIGETLYNGSSTYAPLSGSVDDVRIYNRALSAGEVTTIYNWRGP